MAKKLDVTGKRYGRLTALCFVGNNKWGKRVWRFKCDCGNIKDIPLTRVRQGYTRSCGCLLSEVTTARNKARALPSGEANKRSVYRRYIADAERRDLLFNLTYEQFGNLVKQPCYYCGKQPSNKQSDHTCNGSFIYQGIDRKDNTKGYIVDNCVPCCFECNQIKRAIPYNTFVEWLNRILEFNKSINRIDIRLPVPYAPAPTKVEKKEGDNSEEQND